jgi:hypothetical protein
MFCSDRFFKSPSRGPSLHACKDTIGGGEASGAGPVVIQLNGPAATALLRGEAVQPIANNPRAVAGSSTSAARSNASRRELTRIQSIPGLLTA